MTTSLSSILVVDPAGYVFQKRRGRRQRVKALAMIHDETAGPRDPGRQVQVIDVALAGVGFLSDQPARVGSTWRINLEAPAMYLASRMRITRCARKGKLYEIGAEYVGE